MQRLRFAPVLLILALVLAALGQPAHAADRKLLYRTHVDAAHLAWEGDGLVIKVIDGATPVPADSVYVRLGPDADRTGREVSRLRVPNDPAYGFLGKPGTILWTAPQELLDNHAPVWAGFGVGKFPAALMREILPEKTRLEMVDVKGPGEVHVFGSGTRGPTRMFSSVGDSHRFFHMAPDSHGHLSWSFSKPGRYDITWRGHVDKKDGTKLTSEPTVVTWLVGPDEAVGLPAGTTRGNEITKPIDAEPTPTPTPTPTTKPTTPAPSPSASPTTPASTYNPTKGAKCEHFNAGAIKVASSWKYGVDENGYPDEPVISVTGLPATKLPKYASVVNVPDSVRGPAPTNASLNAYVPAGSQAYRVPGALVLDNTGVAFDKLFETRTDLDYAEGPSRDAVVAVTHGTGDGLTVDLQSADAARHVLRQTSGASSTHDLWFTHPGYYSVTLSSVVVLDGDASEEPKQNYEMTTVWFAVGKDAITGACAGGYTPPAVPTPQPTPTVQPTPQPTPTTPVVTPGPVAEPSVWLDHGHVDAFLVTPTASGLALQLREDVTGSHVVREPSTVGLHVKESALVDLPAGIPGAPKGYLLPLTQQQDLLWPGWDTSASAAAGYGRVDIQVEKVAGPGQVHVFSLDTFGGLKSLLDGGGNQLPGTIVVPQPAHVHANWVFTKPGRYEFTVRANATKDGKQVQSAPQTYVWHVGDKPATPTPAPSTAAPSATGSAETAASAPPAPVVAKAMATTPAAVCRATTVAGHGRQQVATEGHFDLGAQMVDGRLMASLKDDRSAPAAWVSPESVIFQLTDAAKIAAPASLGFLAPAGQPVWLIGATQKAGVPWLGQNTTHPSLVGQTTGPVTWRLVRASGPGKVALFHAGSLGSGVGQRLADNVGGPTVHTVPANTHAHPNWAFTAPGTYSLQFEMSAKATSGGRVSATTTVNFAVGVPARAGTAASSSIVGRTPDGKPCQLPDAATNGRTRVVPVGGAELAVAAELPAIEASTPVSDPMGGQPAPAMVTPSTPQTSGTPWGWMAVCLLAGTGGGAAGALVVGRVRRT